MTSRIYTNWTKTRPYQSIYKRGYITPSAYITELIFKKRSEQFNSGKLPEKFWNMPKYKGSYTGQIIQANRLLKKYHDDSIIKSISDPKAKYIFKLQDTKLIPIIESYEKTRKEKEFVESKEKPRTEVAKKSGNKKNKFGML